MLGLILFLNHEEHPFPMPSNYCGCYRHNNVRSWHCVWEQSSYVIRTARQYNDAHILLFDYIVFVRIVCFVRECTLCTFALQGREYNLWMLVGGYYWPFIESWRDEYDH